MSNSLLLHKELTNMADPCAAGFFSKLFSGNTIVCSDTFKSYEISSGQAQIQSVVDNAPTDYAAEVGQQVADAQKQAFITDVNAINRDVANSDIGTTCDDGSPGIDLTIIGLPCIKYSWLKWGAVGIAALLVLYVVALGNSLVPRRG